MARHADEVASEPKPGERSSGPGSDRTVRTIMANNLVCIRSDLEITSVLELMIERHVGCLPVVDERRRPIGMITKYDLVEQLEVAMRLARCDCPLPTDLGVQTADDVMMPLALTLDENAGIANAASMMISEDIHHVLVVDHDRRLVGVVSAKDIVRWVVEHDVASDRRGDRPSAWRSLEG